MINKLVKSLALLIVSGLFISSCCNDCPCDPEEANEFQCSPREVTITQFNGKLQDTATINTDPTFQVSYYPVAEYSIHSFEFPNSQSSSGSLPNDERFSSNAGIDYIPIATLSTSEVDISSDFFYAVIDDKPANSLITGDILVDSIFLETGFMPSAFLRVRGFITGISLRVNDDNNSPDQFMSESSSEFCDYIETAQDNGQIEKNALAIKATPFGADQLDGNGDPLFTEGAYNANDIVLINQLGQIVVDENGNINEYVVPAGSKLEQSINDILPILNASREEATALLNEIITEKNLKYVQIEVQVGDVFYYRAVNGKSFAVAIINIDERDASPLKKRLSIIFNEL